MGSTLAARRAGTHAATSASNVISAATALKVTGSTALTPNRKLRSNCATSAAAAQPRHRSTQRQHQTLLHHPTDDLPPLRAQRQPDADLPRPPAHDVRDQAVDADAANHHRQPAKRQQQKRQRSRQPTLTQRSPHSATALCVTGTCGSTSATVRRSSAAASRALVRVRSNTYMVGSS